MIGFILPLLARFWKPLLILGVILLWFGLVHVFIEQRVEREKAARDQFWRAAIAQSNAETEKQHSRAREDAAARSRAAEAEIATLRDTLLDLEKNNATLPKGGDCGLDAGRARLLNAR